MNRCCGAGDASRRDAQKTPSSVGATFGAATTNRQNHQLGPNQVRVGGDDCCRVHAERMPDKQFFGLCCTDPDGTCAIGDTQKHGLRPDLRQKRVKQGSYSHVFVST